MFEKRSSVVGLYIDTFFVEPDPFETSAIHLENSYLSPTPIQSFGIGEFLELGETSQRSIKSCDTKTLQQVIHKKISRKLVPHQGLSQEKCQSCGLELWKS